MTATREFALWAGIGAAMMIGIVAADAGAASLGEPRTYWIVPLGAVAVGALAVLRGRLMTAARRRGAEARGMTLEQSEAEGREAERRFARRHPVLHVLVWVALLPCSAARSGSVSPPGSTLRAPGATR